jgi:hypothetical protein
MTDFDTRYEEELIALRRAVLVSLDLDETSEHGKLIITALGEAFHWGEEQARSAAEMSATRAQTVALEAIVHSCNALRSSIESQTTAMRKQTRTLGEFVDSLPHVIEQRRASFRRSLEEEQLRDPVARSRMPVSRPPSKPK